ncbi:hypothetical protein N7488_008869 [Penicillium malachiteum]|nr:hypothetical protein N7488_008869 [Penicillium malachiteum]
MDQLPIFDADNAKIANPGQRQSMGRSISFNSNRDLLWGSQPQFMNGKSHILRKREDDDGDIEMTDVDDEDPNFSQSSALTCPDHDCVTSKSSNPNNLPVCSWILPELRYDCDVCCNAQATKNGATEPVTGICRDVVNFLDRRNLDVSEGVVLTWDSSQDRQDVRRGQACPRISKKAYCSAYNAAIATKLQVPTDSKIVSYDEFPVASSEEGGSYFASLPQNPTSVEVNNVNLSGTAIWQKWASTNDDWFKTSDWQRVVHYTDYIPQAHKIDDTSCQQYNNGHGGWLHKRNFTLSVAQPSGPKDGAAWGLQSLTSWQYSKGTPQDDATQVACAVNKFGQSDRYTNGAKNGNCITGKKQNSSINSLLDFGTVVKVNGCAVTFTGPTAGSSNSKRDGSNETAQEDKTIGEIGGWGIESE